MERAAADGSPGDDGEGHRAEVRERTRRQLIAVAVSSAVLVLAGVVALVVLGGDDDEMTETTRDDDPGPATTLPPAAPPDGESESHPSGLGPAHPLVGRPETEAREVYPVVRVEWIDGEALMLTMDLVPGRVGIAVEDGVIVAAGAEGCEELPPDPAGWQLQACDPSPDDGATVWGRLVEREDGLALEPGAGADRYYEMMQVVPLSADPDRAGTDGRPVVVDLEGARVTESELTAGQAVWIWVTGPCEERYPVGCTIDALVVER